MGTNELSITSSVCCLGESWNICDHFRVGTNELSITSSVCCLVGSGPMTRLVSGSISVVSVNSSGSVSVLLLLLGTLLLRVGASAVKHCCENVLRLFLQSGMLMTYVTGDICLRRYGPSHLCACILDSCLMGGLTRSPPPNIPGFAFLVVLFPHTVLCSY